MRGASAAAAVIVMMVLFPAAAPPLRAQTWNDPRTDSLVRRATARRAAQIADTALAAYSATANGYLTFLGQVGQGLRLPPKILRTDQLALQVYWHAPDSSKQVIVGRRDTLLLPSDMQYHRDHLGIIQNNFPNVIRLGEGDEVKDVPHPLSAGGLAAYDFAISDSLRIRLPGREYYVYEVRVRPKDATLPGVVGAVYVDTASAQVVRMAFSFTRAAYLDKQLEDISIVLENALIESRFWLPYRQEIEIRRAGTWLDFPARGIIRARWEICCYQVNIAVPPHTFIGPEISDAPARVKAAHQWNGGIMDSLPVDASVATDADVRRVQEEARALIAAKALAPRSGAAITANRLSDFARVNRVEGLALGAGGAWHAMPSLSLGILARYGFDDHAFKARASAAFTLPEGRSLTLFGAREYRDVSDVLERSLVVNSLSSQEYGSDFTDPYEVRSVGVTAGLGAWSDVRFTLTGSYEEQSALAVHAVPFRGSYEPTLAVWPLDEWRVSLRVEREWPLGAGSDVRMDGTITGGWLTTRDTVIPGAPVRFGRAFVEATLSQAIGAQRLVLRTTVGGVTPAGAPPQDQVFLGGPITGPGYGYHQFAAAFGASQRVEWRAPLPFPSVPLGSFGRTPASFTLAPYAHVVYVDRTAPFAPPAQGWYASLGIGASFFFDLVRIDVARGLRDGNWYFGIDLAHDLWSIL
jgi:hypothetical protein